MATTTRRIAVQCVAAVVGGLGVGSLSIFGLFLWTGAFGFLELHLEEHSLLVWDGGLCLLFFLQHSGMVRRSFQAKLIRVLPGHWYRVIYTIASAAALLLLVALWQRSTVEIYVATGVGRWLFAALLLACLAGILWGIRSLEQFDAFGIDIFLSQVRQEERHPAKLTVEGPYRLVRHPFYSFGIIALWAAPVLSLDRLLLNTVFTLWIVMGASLEERDLLCEFGEDYRLYQRAVPMFVPRMPALDQGFNRVRKNSANRSTGKPCG
ncbi:MAG: isoprenylcysteine carboxylmethyltransferase family protein [Bryobacterales bacterium]|nr:isoprenylcysteine carboxylmethyltransferase family protein [Bryobacterales bacterium]